MRCLWVVSILFCTQCISCSLPVQEHGEHDDNVYCDAPTDACPPAGECEAIYCRPVHGEPNHDGRWGVCRTAQLADGVACSSGLGHCSMHKCIQEIEPPPYECDTRTDCGYEVEGCMLADCHHNTCYNGYYVPGTSCLARGMIGECIVDAAHKRTICDTSNPR